MTVLSFGGALPDFIVDTSLARTGYAEMALAGTIGAPVFGITFGLGLCLIKKLITNEDHTMVFDLLNFETNPDSKILVAGMITISVIVIELMISGCVLKFQIRKVVSFIGYSLYGCFVLSLAYFTFIEPHFIKK
jgi:Ca2+/Na+ antiporter